MNTDTTIPRMPALSAPTYRVDALADLLHSTVDGCGELVICGVNALDQAGEHEITYIGSPRHAGEWSSSRAAAAVVSEGIDVPGHDAATRALIRVRDADLALAEILKLFAPPRQVVNPVVHPSAQIDPTAEVDPSASVGAFVIVGAKSRIGARSVLEPGVHLGAQVMIGADCTLRAGVVIRSRCILHDRVSIHPNAVIGADGFGYRPDGQGGLCKLEHIGMVEIHDDVEIGACSTIDRGKFGKTEIGAHTKLDNLVQIGHNVRLGKGCVLASQVGIAGSCVIGDYCRLGAKSGVADHRVLGNRVQLAAKCGVMHDTPDDATLCGIPGIDIRQFWRIQSASHKLPALVKTLARLEEEIEALKRRDEQPEA